MVADRESKRPFERRLGVGDKVTAAAFNRRMLCYPMGGNEVRKGNIVHLLLFLFSFEYVLSFLMKFDVFTKPGRLGTK
eukprot:COSAG06_NODE_13980_length_1200_cov_2.573115_1_plen_78_part_00